MPNYQVQIGSTTLRVRADNPEKARLFGIGLFNAAVDSEGGERCDTDAVVVEEVQS